MNMIYSMLGVDSNRYSSEAPKESTSQVYVMSMRWSVSHDVINQKDLFDWCKLNCKKFIFQAEQTDNDGKLNPHYQGYVNLKQKRYANQLGRSLNDRFLGIQFLPASENGKEALKNYCMKDETRVDGPWADHEIYRGQDLPTQLRSWQQSLYDIVKGPANDRHVLWICDLDGNTGKSIFTKMMGFKFDALPLCYANAKDLINLVSQFMHKRAYIFDLTRSKPTDHSVNDVYSVIEQVKGGTIINTKYQTSIQYMNSPHVIVFANYMPDQKKLSLDRWKFYKIENMELKNK